jgi:outer membrane lipoprotein-sorting protein
MPKTLYTIVALSATFLLAGAFINAQEGPTADEIIETMTETMNPETSQGKMRMTITTSTGQDRTFVYEAFSKGKGDKSMMKYLEPSRVKGQAILMLNDANDIWVYFPRTGRVRKLASHAKKQKVEGSDFSYEDLGASDTFIDEYDAVRLEDGRIGGSPTYVLELTRKKESSASYSRVVIQVEKESLVPLIVDYYHEKDAELHEKQLTCSDIELIEGIHTAKKCVMHNMLDDTRTTMEIVEVKYNVELSDDMFTKMGMKK